MNVQMSQRSVSTYAAIDKTVSFLVLWRAKASVPYPAFVVT